MANNAQVTTRSSVQRSLSALVLHDFKKGLRVVLQQLAEHVSKARVMATLALKHYLTTLQEVQPLTPNQTILARMYSAPRLSRAIAQRKYESAETGVGLSKRLLGSSYISFQ